MKNTTKTKTENVAKPNRIDLGNPPIKSTDILYKKVFGMGQETVQGKGAATKGTKYNKCVSGKR